LALGAASGYLMGVMFDQLALGLIVGTLLGFVVSLGLEQS